MLANVITVNAKVKDPTSRMISKHIFMYYYLQFTTKINASSILVAKAVVLPGDDANEHVKIFFSIFIYTRNL